MNLIVTTFPLSHALWVELYARFYIKKNIDHSQIRKIDRVNILWRLLNLWERNQKLYEIIGLYPTAEEQTFFTDAISTNEKIMYELGRLNVACTQGTFEHCYVQPRQQRRNSINNNGGMGNKTMPMQTDGNRNRNKNRNGNRSGSNNSSDSNRNEDESKLDRLDRLNNRNRNSRHSRFEQASRPKRGRTSENNYSGRGRKRSGSGSGSSGSSTETESIINVNDCGKIINLRSHYSNEMLDYVDALWCDDWQRGPKLLFGDNDQDKYRKENENRQHSGGMLFSISLLFFFFFFLFLFLFFLFLFCSYIL